MWLRERQSSKKMLEKLKKLIAEGKNNKEIAKVFKCCVQTIAKTIERNQILDTRLKAQKRAG